MGVGTLCSCVVGGGILCAQFSLFARRTALVDSRFRAGMPPGVDLWLRLGALFVLVPLELV